MNKVAIKLAVKQVRNFFTKLNKTMENLGAAAAYSIHR